MVKINVLAVGKVKEKYFIEGIEEYSKRLSKFCEFNIVELKEENYKNVDTALINAIKEKEGNEILNNLKGYCVCMAIEGEKYSSEKFSNFIKNLKDTGVNEITFIIGGSYGIAEKVKNKANKLISFSDLTFPHTLFRLILTEQIYRAFSIINGSAYHK